MSVEEKQARSVFVGNIPHGTTEEQMKDIFCAVGTVLSFRIVYDRETGNPKGYGFAEYSDMEMAQSAIRNLNGYEYNGRTLRVDKASSQSEELRLIHQQTGGGGVASENPYGENVSPDKAPEAISRAVASLPPEQMYELMKQMKLCIQNNMNEARTMLLNNPQLAYALLQAQVIMRIVDPQVAMKLLHRHPDQISPVMPASTSPIQNLMRPPMMQQPTMISGGAMPPIMQPVPQQPMPRVASNAAIDPRFPPNMPARSTNPSRPTPSQPPSNVGQVSASTATALPGSASAAPVANAQISNVDKEKAALIIQVLQLKDEQIAMLPPEQRQSILLLKEQIAQSAGGLLPSV